MTTPPGPIRIPSWPVFGEAEERNLVAVLHSGRWFSGMTGSDENTRTLGFEEEFARYQDAKHAVAVANGTAALEISLRAVGVGPGDEVIVPAYTFIATASAVSQVGATPVIVDVQPNDLNIDPDRVAEAVSGTTKAIIPVHVGGQIADMVRLRDIAAARGLMIIEDCAHAQGSVRYGATAGSHGVAGCFSFQHAKTMSGGEGGVIVTHDDDVADRCRSLRSCGRTDPTDPYLHGLLGWNYRMTEWQSAVLSAQLQRAEAQRRQRERGAEMLRQLLADSPFYSPLVPQPGTTQHNYYYFTMLMTEAANRASVTKAAVVETMRAHGVPASGGYPRPIGDNPVFDTVRARRQPSPIADMLCERAIHLPHNVLLADDETLVAIRDVLVDAARAQADRASTTAVGGG